MLLLVILVTSYTGNFLFINFFENIYIFFDFVYIYNIEKNLKIKFGFKIYFLYICNRKEKKSNFFLFLIYFFVF